MNKFYEIKNILDNKTVIHRYLGNANKVNSSGEWYKSPFRSEKTASFVVNDKYIHDFGESKNYDIISFVARYYSTNMNEAYKILCTDFGINITNEYETNYIVEKLKRQKKQEQEIKEKIEKWYNKEIKRVIDTLQRNEKEIELVKKYKSKEAMQYLYSEQVKLEVEWEELYNRINDKENLYLERCRI